MNTSEITSFERMKIFTVNIKMFEFIVFRNYFPWCISKGKKAWYKSFELLWILQFLTANVFPTGLDKLWGKRTEWLTGSGEGHPGTSAQDGDKELGKLKNRDVTTRKVIPSRAQGWATAKCQIKGVQKDWFSHDVQVQSCPGTKTWPQTKEGYKTSFQFQYFWKNVQKQTNKPCLIFFIFEF